MNLGAYDFLTKPIDMQELEATIRKTLLQVQALKTARGPLEELRRALQVVVSAAGHQDRRWRLVGRFESRLPAVAQAARQGSRWRMTVPLRLHDWLSSAPPHLADEEVDVYALSNYTTGMAMLAHAVFGLEFAFLHVPVMALYNVLSVLIFVVALVVSKRGQVNLALGLGSAEVMVHAWLATVYVGWQSGFHFYVLLATAVMSLFIRIPVLRTIVLSLLQLSGYVMLAIYGEPRRAAAASPPTGARACSPPTS